MQKTIAEILAALAQPIPASLKQNKKKGGATFTYVAWYDLADLLDERAPGWEYRIEPQAYPHHWVQTKNNKEIERHGLMAVAKSTLTIHGSDGSLTREAIAYQDPEEAYIGDELTNVEASAFRRNCAKLGLGRDMWRKDKRQPQRQNRPQQSTNGAARKQQPADKQLSPDMMIGLLRTMLNDGYEGGAATLEKSIAAATKRVVKFPEDRRKEVLNLINGYSERLSEFQEQEG
jgi:hypothetical protein